MAEINSCEKTITLFGDCAIHMSCKGIPHQSAFGMTNWLSVISERSEIFEKLTQAVVNEPFVTNYAKRVLLLNSNKKIVDYIFQSKSDFFIFDCADCRKQLLVETLTNDSQVRYLTLHDDIEKAVANGSLSFPSGVQVKNCYDIDINEYYKAADFICERILQQYLPERIVLVQRRPSDCYYSSSGIHLIDRSLPVLNQKSVQVVEAVERYVINLLSKSGKINVIRFPYNVLADPLHHLGIYPYHHCPIYYEYVRKSVECVLSNTNESVLNLLNIIYLYYSLKLEKFKDDIVNKRSLENTRELNNFLINYIANCVSCAPIVNLHSFSSLKAISDINNYLDALYLLRFSLIIIVSVKDTCGFYNDNETLTRLKRLGFESFPSKLQNVYLGIMINNMKFLDKSGEPQDFLEFNNSLFGMVFHIVSSSFINGNTSMIEVNSIDYSLNDRGINIVVIDSQTRSVIDSVSYDSHLMDYLKHRAI